MQCSLIERDLDRCDTEIDFGSGMKRLTFELSLIRGCTGKNKTNTSFQ